MEERNPKNAFLDEKWGKARKRPKSNKRILHRDWRERRWISAFPPKFPHKIQFQQTSSVYHIHASYSPGKTVWGNLGEKESIYEIKGEKCRKKTPGTPINRKFGCLVLSPIYTQVSEDRDKLFSPLKWGTSYVPDENANSLFFARKLPIKREAASNRLTEPTSHLDGGV